MSSSSRLRRTFSSVPHPDKFSPLPTVTPQPLRPAVSSSARPNHRKLKEGGWAASVQERRLRMKALGPGNTSALARYREDIQPHFRSFDDAEKVSAARS